MIDLTLRNFVEITLISTFLPSFYYMSSAKPFFRGFLFCWGPDWASTKGMASTIKSKKGSTLPSNGLLSLIERIRNPYPFCKNEPLSFVLPIII